MLAACALARTAAARRWPPVLALTRIAPTAHISSIRWIAPADNRPLGLDSAVSTVDLGTTFERLVQAELARFRMRLRRVGGAGDGGVDLVGQWYLDADPPSPDEQPAVALLRTLRSNAAAPPSPHTDSAPAPVSVLVQCKAEQSAVGPGAVRDLLGTLASQYDSAATLGILVSLNGFTRQAIATAEGTATDSSVRGGAVCLATVTAAGTCTTFWVAPAASRLLGGHLRAVSAAGGRVRMSWRGTPLR